MRHFLMAATLCTAFAGTAAMADDAKPAKVLDRKAPDFVRCIRTAPVGSMIKTVKVCRTNAEWQHLTDTEGKEARDMVERNQGLPSGQ